MSKSLHAFDLFTSWQALAGREYLGSQPGSISMGTRIKIRAMVILGVCETWRYRLGVEIIVEMGVYLKVACWPYREGANLTT